MYYLRHRNGRFRKLSSFDLFLMKLCFLIFIISGGVGYASSYNQRFIIVNNQEFFSSTSDTTEKLDIKPLAVLESDEKSPVKTQETKEVAFVNYTDKGLASEIEAYIRGKDWNDEHALLIARCESGLNPYAFNPETEPKRKGLTRYSSCGIFQINSPICTQADNVLYDYKYNIDTAYKMWQTRFWQPWINCSAKYNISIYR